MRAFRCNLCPRRCGALRTEKVCENDRSSEMSQQSGSAFCGCPSVMYIAHWQVHMWEEPPISGSRGSGTIFFSGCGLGCIYCQNSDISRANGNPIGKPCTPEQLADIMRELEQKGVHNISFVTGTQFVPDIIAALRLYRPSLPIVWNCSGYEEISVIDALAKYVDIWLPDYKYGLSAAAEKYSFAADYPQKALAAIKHMRLMQPENIFDDDGIMQKGVIVRQLVLPLNTKNSIRALELLAEELPGVPVSIMSQYTPMFSGSNYPELERRITAREYDKVCDAADRMGICGYTQEQDSAEKSYIPDFGSVT